MRLIDGGVLMGVFTPIEVLIGQSDQGAQRLRPAGGARAALVLAEAVRSQIGFS